MSSGEHWRIFLAVRSLKDVIVVYNTKNFQHDRYGVVGPYMKVQTLRPVDE